jgi:hypothetical protein
MSGWETYAIEGGRLLWQMIPASNPSVGATLVADDGLVNMTPQVRVDLGDQVRRAVYLPPHAIREGPVVVTRMSPALDAPYIVEITNFQCADLDDLFWGESGGAGGDTAWGSGPGSWGS